MPRRKTIRKIWTAAEDDYLREHYPNRLTWAIAVEMGRSESSVYDRALIIGLKKSAAHAAELAARNGENLATAGIHSRFLKGHRPHNKGVKGFKSGGRSAETQFRKGQRGSKWVPVGSERISKDGIRQRKVSATGYPPRDWKSVHQIVWEAHHGKVPRGHIVTFKDGNRDNICIENLELISRAENMRRNSIHRMPEGLRSTIHTLGVLNRHINRRGKSDEKRNEKQDRRSARPLVPDHREAAR